MKLKSISIEYEDGNTRKIESSCLDGIVYSALTAAGYCNQPEEIVSSRHYMILEWQDGWKEVLAIDSEHVNLIRYYFIRRIEDIGRIALDIGADFPKLVLINRIPKDLRRISLVGQKKVKAYSLRSEVESYEGIFEAGGKKEYKRYDRDNPIFKEEFSDSDENLTKIEQSIVKALEGKGLRPENVLKMDYHQRFQEYAEIARFSGLKGFEKQSDVYGFIETVLKNLSDLKD